MIISREYTLSPKTSLADKQQDVVKVGKGTIKAIIFQSAPGVNGEVYARIIHFESSICPDETGEWIPLTGTRQEYNMHFNQWNKVYEVTIELCAPDARFQHKINVEIELDEEVTLQEMFSNFIKGGFKSQNL